MKTLLIALFFITSFQTPNTALEVVTLQATYDGYYEGTYNFTDSEEETYYFDSIDNEISKKFNLKEDSLFEGKKFKISYITVVDQYEDETLKITKLELVK